ncbi:MAG: ankyrin repeat domain-containing protein, partial [Planctomycetota bacterium]
MNRICIAALATVMICGPGCEPSAQERVEATEKLLSVWDEDIQGSDTYSIMVLIGDGADVNASDKNGKTPLMFAARFSSTPEIVTALVAGGAEVNAMSSAGWTPLMFAAGFSSTPEIVSALVAGGAEVNAMSKAGWTPLMFAAAFSETA